MSSELSWACPYATDDKAMSALAQLRARHALSAAKLDVAGPLEPVESVNNEVWMTAEYVVRINRRASGRLQRESKLAAALPAASGYPGIVAVGEGPGNDWIVMARKPGCTLASAWPSMTEHERKTAVGQFANRLRTIHDTAAPEDLSPIVSPQLVDATSPWPWEPLLGAIRNAAQANSMPTSLLDATQARVSQLLPIAGHLASTHLVHGDLTFENVLWDGQRVSAVVDFEWACGGPRDLDLDVFLRMCAYPFLHTRSEYSARTRSEDYVAVPRWLRAAYPELFATPGLAARLELYAIGFDLNELLRFPPTGNMRDLPKYHALNRLNDTLAGRGHLSRVLPH